ncbi:hypothetical protein AWN76_016475 [Rhodothermaceae bacterium RA]|nr:hypothetical protein AWN76_016475 [Rhodothermaceae bacterium RA]
MTRVPRFVSARFAPFLAAGAGLLGLVLLPALALTNSVGAPTGRAGDPPLGSTCAAGGCHASYPLNSGPGALQIEAPDTYVPGEPLTIRVRVSQADMVKAGFQVTVRDVHQLHAGQLALVDATASKNADALGQYVTHTRTGTAPTADGERVWEVTWSAPEDVGPVTIYAAGLAANGNNTASGDHVYTTRHTLTPATASSIEPAALPGRFTLHPAYPNPFTTSTRIRFDLARSEAVTLRLIDGLGRTVHMLDLGVQPAGPHEAYLSGDGLPAGLYVYELRTPHGRATRPVLLVK